MTSLISNSSATAALATLRHINSQLDQTQSNISTGYRVQEASDDVAYWSIATTMRSDEHALAAVQDAMGVGAAKTDTAYAGMEAAIDIVSEFKAKLVLAAEPSVDKLKIIDELTKLKDQLRAVASSASFNGENWLKFDTGDDPVAIGNPKVVTSFVRKDDDSVSLQTMTFDLITYPESWPFSGALIDDSLLTHGEFGILTTDTYAYNLGLSTGYMLIQGRGSGTTYMGTPVLPQVEIALSETTTHEQISEMASVVDYMLSDMQNSAAKIGAMGMRIGLQDDFVTSLRSSVNSGVSRLVDANMEEEAGRLRALQSQKELGIQALSIANNSAQILLSLFR
ncbi:flagellin [Agrobacterium vaccinii]|uniref:flagellin N-terminal helical domain-containing protein n=1 Tax=Agrobacterium vaccinii TaxID=2735528 RepID=UPI001E579F6D|nr:flagellin [Agrobacterium vaccinii]UHS61912.1 flagellin [Agrobacterium vaccinii]